MGGLFGWIRIMAPRIIRSVKDLPDWYDLNNYQNSLSLDSSSWYDLLLQRWNHFFWFEHSGVEKYKKRFLDNDEDPFYSALLQSRKYPLSLLTDNLQISLIGGGQLEALKYDQSDFATFSHAIKPLTIRRMYQQENKLKKSTRDRIRKWFDTMFGDNFFTQFTDEYKAECKWALSFVDDPIFEAFENQGKDKEYYSEERHYDLVEIDLSLSDKILIKQFSDYLRGVRYAYPDIKKPHKHKYPEYKKWVDYGVLPFLDLELWAIENYCSIPNRVMADAIFPSGEKGEEMVRKTTKKISRVLMEKEYIDFLATIVANDITEKK
jgi:hypothetical protein